MRTCSGSDGDPLRCGEEPILFKIPLAGDSGHAAFANGKPLSARETRHLAQMGAQRADNR